MTKHSQKFLRHRRFLTVMPLLVLPFLTMIFWILGGGKNHSLDSNLEKVAGLNLSLPGAYFKNEKLDKLSLYQKVKNDSLKLLQERRNDPYFELNTISKTSIKSAEKSNTILHNSENKTATNLIATHNGIHNTDVHEELVNQKLEEINKIINNSAKDGEKLTSYEDGYTSTNDDNQLGADVERLEQMMEVMRSGNMEEDPEMAQLQGMIEQILDIQHPERVRQKIKEQSLKDQKKVFPVQAGVKDEITFLQPHILPEEKDPVLDSLLQNFPGKIQNKSGNKFYGLDDIAIEEASSKGIQAVVHETQNLVNGSFIKLRLLDDVYVKGQLIPKGHFIFGRCQINMERLHISIPSIKYVHSLFPVALTAYDMDGLEGIYIPGAITQNVAQQASDQALQNLNLQIFDPSIAAQATTAGINAARGLISKKVKQIKVTIKAGYQLLLADEH